MTLVEWNVRGRGVLACLFVYLLFIDCHLIFFDVFFILTKLIYLFFTYIICVFWIRLFYWMLSVRYDVEVSRVQVNWLVMLMFTFIMLIYKGSIILSGWFSNVFCMFTPTWGNDPTWRACFSDGLKPLSLNFVELISISIDFEWWEPIEDLVCFLFPSDPKADLNKMGVFRFLFTRKSFAKKNAPRIFGDTLNVIVICFAEYFRCGPFPGCQWQIKV